MGIASLVNEEPRTFTLYAFPGGPYVHRGEFTVAPSRSFEVYDLRLGLIDLGARLPVSIGLASGSVLSEEGGSVTEEGYTLSVPAGALDENLPVQLASIAESEWGTGIPMDSPLSVRSVSICMVNR
jgi:hypothetical protein